MKIKSFFDNRCNDGVTYSYTKRHMNTPYYPDAICERYNLPVYDKMNGGLFFDSEVAWKGEVLLNGGIDINVSLAGRKFVDHITLRQGEGSAIGSIEIFTDENSSLKKIGTFSQAGCIKDEFIEIPVGYFGDNIIIRLNGCYEKISLRKLDVIGSEDVENAIYPVPEKVEEKEGELPFASIKTITYMCDDAFGAVEYISEKLLNKFDIDAVTGNDGEIVFTYIERDDDGYEIEVTDNKCTIKAGSLRAFIYAADTFLQLATETGFKACNISDKPFMEIRGVHFALPSRKDIPFLKKLIKYVWVPMKYNTVFLQLSGVMRYDSYPEINDKWTLACTNYEKGEWPMPAHYHFLGHDILDKDEISDLCDYIRSFGLEIVPEVESLSHSQYITTAFPHLAEVDPDEVKVTNIYAADEKPQSFYAHNMCPSHDDYYKIIFALIDEAIELIKPEKYIHMGHDELYIHGKCERCSKKGSAKVFAEEVTRLNDYIKSKNLSMMIWSDMLQNEYYSVPEAINDIPKDVIMLDFTWYFHPEQDLEVKLLSHGLKVVMGNMYSSHYPRYNSRSVNPGIIGAEVSTWVDLNEHSYAYEGKMYDFIYSANMMWNREYDDTCRLTYNEVVKDITWDVRKVIADIDMSGEVKNLVLDGDMKNTPNELLWNIPYDKTTVVDMNKEVEIMVDDTADTVFFTQATDLPAGRVMWTPAQQIGEYEFVYDDGETITMPIYYGVSIMEYGRKYARPIDSFLYRHEGYIGTYMAKPVCGKDSKGCDYTLYDYPVKNPNPEKIIKKVIVRHMNNTDSKILLFNVRTIKN